MGNAKLGWYVSPYEIIFETVLTHSLRLLGPIQMSDIFALMGFVRR